MVSTGNVVTPGLEDRLALLAYDYDLLYSGAFVEEEK